jgi:hypothetical protein
MAIGSFEGKPRTSLMTRIACTNRRNPWSQRFIRF